jgi:glycosyltransferase involved in cell wall biosynthesis
LYARAKVAVVACTDVDSCPRVIPESLACNCPLLVLDRVNFWHSKYITPQTGRLCNKDTYAKTLASMVENYQSFSPREYYCEHLSLDVAAKQVMAFISSLKDRRGSDA